MKRWMVGFWILVIVLIAAGLGHILERTDFWLWVYFVLAVVAVIGVSIVVSYLSDKYDRRLTRR